MITLLVSSSFSFPQFFSQLVKPSQAQFNFAQQQNNQQVLLILRKNSQQGSKQWLRYSLLLAQKSADAAIELAYYYKQQEPQQTLVWLKQALILGDDKQASARRLLAQHYVNDNKLNKAFNLLLPVIKINQNALLMASKLALDLGNIEFINKYKNNLLRFEQGQDFWAKLKHFDVFQEELGEGDLADKANHCLASIQLVASTLVGLQHAESLMTDFKRSSLAQYFCFAPVRYLAQQFLSCQSEHQQAIVCQDKALAPIAEQFSSRYLAIIHQQGGANVDKGILHLDLADNVDVFAHEVSHLLGFIDEYPLIKGHQACLPKKSEGTVAHNIVVFPSNLTGSRAELRAKMIKSLPWGKYIKETTPIMSKVEQGWQLGTPDAFSGEVGLFKAETCDNSSDTQAFKASNQQSKLRYYEQDFPELYHDILKNSPDKRLMPSFYYNIAYDYFLTGDEVKARYWLQKAAQYEKTSLKAGKVLQGAL